jgi:hypothetical protein
LDGARAGFLSRVHAIVDGKVAANHIGACGGGVTSECFGGIVLTFSAVFAVVDPDYTGVTVASDRWSEHGLRPMSAFAETCTKSWLAWMPLGIPAADRLSCGG